MILYRYILRNHAAPFLFSIITLIFVFLLQFLMKFADKLVGKGLGFFIIAKLIAYNLAWIIVLVVPMAVLVSTLMAFGSMSQNNEIATMKASGMSLYRMTVSPLLASIALFFLLVYFNNNIYPDANHHARLLMQDISNKKPALSLVPGVFSQEMTNYAILVREKDEDSNMLYGITIYDYNDPVKVNVVTAKKGKVYFSQDQKKLMMDLENGEIHEFENAQRRQNYRKIVFEKHRIGMNAEQFSFQQSTPGGPRGDRELGAPTMQVIVDSLQKIQDGVFADLRSDIARNLNFETAVPAKKPEINTNEEVMRRVKEKITAARNSIEARLNQTQYFKERISQYSVEIHKKYSLPAACIIFILIGAPLGMMTRKGGFGVAAGISLIFFLVYWAFLIGGEKLADRGLLSPFWGIWSANIFLGLIGIWLTIKSAQERMVLDFSRIKNLIPKSWRFAQDDNENS